ncbi:hypothetical protein CFN78_10920 [Amycolatopsis antarctica]|uniref:Glycosyltransferase RgtA/B/C/D-like domain-containing protein n=1 Tax=Amycolatopsis antarctica TaxID=1854586 RepID=A0A263D7T3_9PSEU|nr:hypothetical protein CFN78_10920 [Amycolatopsis antarctica]
MIYLAIREFGVLMLWIAGRIGEFDLVTALTVWDGQWYLGIAAGGYADTPDTLADAYGTQSAETPLAFFPGYPTIVRWAEHLPGLTLAGAALLVSTASGVLAAYALARLGRIVRGGSPVAGYVLVALFAAAPMGVVLSMAYSEAMFCALAAWALVFVLERRWLWAGGCCALAGLVRPTVVALVLAVALAALLHALRSRHLPSRVGAVLGAAIAPAGLLGYLSWAGDWIRPQADWLDRMGSWTELQENGWGSHFDGGLATTRFAGTAITRLDVWQDVAAVLVAAGFVALLVFAYRRRLEWPLLVYGAGVLVMTLGSAGLMTSKARLLLPAFTLLVPVAVALARRRTATRALVLGGAAVASSWFGYCALIIWENAI